MVLECGSKGKGKGCEVIMSLETPYLTALLPSLVNVILASKISPPEGEESTILVTLKSVYLGIGGGAKECLWVPGTRKQILFTPISQLPGSARCHLFGEYWPGTQVPQQVG